MLAVSCRMGSEPITCRAALHLLLLANGAMRSGIYHYCRASGTRQLSPLEERKDDQ